LEKLIAVQENPNIFEVDKLKEASDNDFRAFDVFFRLTCQINAELNESRMP